MTVIRVPQVGPVIRESRGVGIGVAVARRRARRPVDRAPPVVLGRDRLVVRKVESQPVGSDQGAGLFDMIAQHLAQRPVQNMGGGMVAHRGLAGGRIHLQTDRIVFGDPPGDREHLVVEIVAGRRVVVAVLGGLPRLMNSK